MLVVVPCTFVAVGTIAPIAPLACLVSTSCAVVFGIAALSDPEQRDDARAALVRAGGSTAIAATAVAAAAYVLAQSLASGGRF